MRAWESSTHGRPCTALLRSYRRLRELIEMRSPEVIQAAFDGIIAGAERRLRDGIQTIPDGRYTFSDVMDGDGLDAFDLPVKVTITIAGRRARFDFTGTSPQVPGNMNTTVNATQASVCYALKAVLDPDIPNSQGVLDTAEISAPPGTILNAQFPASVAARAHTCQRIVDVVLGALAQGVPDQVVAAANGANTTTVFAGRNPETGVHYVYLETLGGGVGGRPDRDGKDGVQAHMTNTSNLPIEAIEMEYPLLVEEYSLIADSGGAGKFRGGLGLRRVIRPLGHDCTFNGVGERFRHAPWGLFGGQDGGCGQFRLLDDDGNSTKLGDKSGDLVIRNGQRVVVETPGAGGYGNPQERNPALREQDRRSEKFSAEYLSQYEF